MSPPQGQIKKVFANTYSTLKRQLLLSKFYFGKMHLKHRHTDNLSRISYWHCSRTVPYLPVFWECILEHGKRGRQTDWEKQTDRQTDRDKLSQFLHEGYRWVIEHLSSLNSPRVEYMWNVAFFKILSQNGIGVEHWGKQVQCLYYEEPFLELCFL